ncbi:MAG: Cof-type HAD-IIB family hydrolase [Acutalibacteraceae bacterium]|nr:Cof-type HAD-IIB family hydrolase [Acutalibacteraceae bacterium]
MSYDVIALDIDGTLTNSKKEITERTRHALIEAQKRGKKVILASGRHNSAIQRYANELELAKYGGYIMSFNGGRIINASDNTIISEAYFPKEYICSVCDCVSGEDITVITYDKDTIVLNEKTNEYSDIEVRIIGLPYKVVDNFIGYITFDINKILLTGEPSLIDRYKKIIEKKYSGILDVFKSCPFFLELMPYGINKGTGLSFLSQKTGFTREQLIACGDSFNDISMIEYAGLGVCMQNGENDVKRIADVIADSNDNDGIAEIVEKYMLQ